MRSATQSLLMRWTRFWNTYDLDALDGLFVMDDRVTYFSSEKQGVLRGSKALREHHVGFGFVPGGKIASNALWLEHVAIDPVDRGAMLVTAIWRFRRGSAPDITQRGPLSAVAIITRDGPRFIHMNFSTYLPPA